VPAVAGLILACLHGRKLKIGMGLLATGVKYWNKHGGEGLCDEQKKRPAIFPLRYLGI